MKPVASPQRPAGGAAMVPAATNVATEDPIRNGESCLLSVIDEHFLVRILEVDEGKVRVSFPGKDYPVEGMRVYLEFHDDTGFDCFPTHVRKGPSASNPSLELERPSASRRVQHRTSFRIPTDLTVQVKDQVHIRRYDASLLNLSSGGALVQSNAPFDFSTTVEVFFSLPGEPSYTTLGQIVHVSVPEGAPAAGNNNQLFGIRFLELNKEIINSLNRYLSQRLRDIYPHR
jgi:hypothetical protein